MSLIFQNWRRNKWIILEQRLVRIFKVSGLMGLCIVILAAFNCSTHNNASDFSRGIQIGIFIGITLKAM